MSVVWQHRDVIAILTADWHLSHRPPVFRSAEPDWKRAMARPLRELGNLATNLGAPIIIAGDIFDQWNSPAELINFAIRRMPALCYAIPGNHDLPMHRLADRCKSAYYTLYLANAINDLADLAWPNPGERLALHPFQLNEPLKPLRKKKERRVINLAVIHKYVWMTGHSFPGAPPEAHVSKVRAELAGYDAILSGDNHRGFLSHRLRHKQGKVPPFLNAGSLMVRKSDERDYKPSVGLLHKNGTITRHFLDTSEDKYLEVSGEQARSLTEGGLDLAAFVSELEELGDNDLNFTEAVRRFVSENERKLSSEARDLLTMILDKVGKR